MSTAHLLLQQAVQGLCPMAEEELIAFCAAWESGSAGRLKELTPAGETEKYLYFIVHGVQRVVHRTESGKETTLVFSYPPSFGGVLNSFLLQKPSPYAFETLSKTNYLRLHWKDFDQLCTRYPSVRAMVQTGLAHTLDGLLERISELQAATAEEKFKNLLRRSPHILQLVPHKYLATYIGIDPTNFSKFLNKVQL